MNVLFKTFLYISFLLVGLNSFAQYDYDDDLEFVKKKKRKKSSSDEKRKFNIHLEAGFSLATITGSGAKERQDTLTAVKNRNNLDSYNIEPIYFPYGKINASFNFSELTSLTVGIKYKRIGWTDFAKVDRSNLSLRYSDKFEFNYIGVPISFQLHFGKHLSFNAGHEFSYLIAAEIVNSDYYIVNGVVRRDKKSRTNFKNVTNVDPQKILSQLSFGTDFGSSKFRFSTTINFTGNFIIPEIPFGSFSIEAGLILKIFDDYE